MSNRNANPLELRASSGDSLVVNFGEPAWPDHVHIRYRGSTEFDLGNLYMEHYASKFSAWIVDRDVMEAAGTLAGLSVACVATFSPHQFVCYGSLSPASHILLIQDAKTSPVRTVAQMQLDAETVAAWRRIVSG